MIDVKKMRDAIITAIDNAPKFKTHDICMTFEYSRYEYMDSLDIAFHNHDETHFYHVASDGSAITHSVICDKEHIKDDITYDQLVADVTDLFTERGIFVNVT